MLIDLVWSAPPALLVAVTAAYVSGLLWALAEDVLRFRWREFHGWRVLQRARVARVGPPVAPVLGSGYFARRRWHRAYGCGWRSVQRHRIARWHYAAR